MKKSKEESKKEPKIVTVNHYIGFFIAITSAIGVTIGLVEQKNAVKRLFFGEKYTLMELIKKDQAIQRIVEETNNYTDSLKIYPASRSNLYMGDDYRNGIYVEDHLTGVNIVLTNEHTMRHINSIWGVSDVTPIFLLAPYVREIQDDGIFIVDPLNPVQNKDMKDSFISFNIKSAVYIGVYRQPNYKNEKPYLIGAVLVAYIDRYHVISKNEIEVYKAKMETVAVLIELLYEKHIK